jgi:hypothetical protein
MTIEFKRVVEYRAARTKLDSIGMYIFQDIHGDIIFQPVNSRGREGQLFLTIPMECKEDIIKVLNNI